MKKYEFDELKSTQNSESDYHLTEDDTIKVNEWNISHSCEYTKDPLKIGAIGGRLTFEFIPTSLGNIINVKCVCGEKLNLTNTNNW